MIRRLSKFKPPDIFWEKIKNKILFRDYELSLVFANGRLMSRLNKEYRGKSGPTDVLSFRLGPKEGEIFLKLPLEKKRASVLYLHALLHLKGFGHKNYKEEKRMRRQEKKWQKMLF